MNEVFAEYSGHISTNPGSVTVVDAVQPKVSELATKYNVHVDTVIGIIHGRYDHIAGITRGGKVRLLRGKKQHEVLLYDSKGYASSGKSIAGAVEMSQDGMYLKCHECGEWHSDLSLHVNQNHGMKAREYKLKHQLKLKTALINEPLRLKRALTGINRWATYTSAQKEVFFKAQAIRKKAKKSDAPKGRGLMYLNSNRTCPVQSLHDLKALAKTLGRAPGCTECRKNGISVEVLRKNYGTLKNANKIAGIDAPMLDGAPRWYSDEELVALLRDFAETHGRQPVNSDCKRGLLPSYITFVRRLGSWDKALKLAGFKGKQTGVKKRMEIQGAILNGSQKIVNGYYV